ncbi:MAG TPA: hypothetical protein VIG51_07440 [Candidatus Baltobacteraceae bacterium]|jgi:hypothetical protein
MDPTNGQEDSTLTRRTYTPAEAAADLANYRKFRRSASLGTLFLVTLAALLLVHWSAPLALALAVGGLCGVGNAWLVMYGNERLADSRRVGIFVISSLLRIGVFGIVPVLLALRSGSLWSLGLYFAGFFIPLALYALLLRRSM